MDDGVVLFDKTVVHGADAGLVALESGVSVVIKDQGLVGVCLLYTSRCV